MKVWPVEKEKMQRLTASLLVLSAVAILLIGFLFWQIKNLSQSPPCTSVASSHLSPKALPCFQQTDESGWKIVNGRLRVFPRCLTVMNSRFGSRFNLDWYFSNHQATSSVLGTLEDKNTFFTLTIQDKHKTEQIFPLLSNDAFPVRSVDLGLTFQKINFENSSNRLSLTITSPFSPSQSATDPNTRLSSAPFFYLQLELANKTSYPQNKTINLTMNGVRETRNQSDYRIAYLNDPVRNDGIRALAAPKSLTLLVSQKQAGFKWPVKIQPNSTQATNLVYAGFLDGPVITDHSQTEKRPLKFAYQHWFKNIDEVISFALSNQKEILTKTAKFENQLNRKSLSPQTKWLLAQAFHSYLGNSWLVYDPAQNNSFEYYVWEGPFKYINTLDVAHDYAALEGLYFPWVLKLELESWRKSAKKDGWGLVIPHDLGHRFRFNGSQAYGIEGSDTSGMPVEENANFILLAYWYYHQTKDQVYLKSLSPLINKLVNSLIKRDSNGNGIADQGIRMTTYDNDGNTALKAGPDNTYLATKQLAAYAAAEAIFKISGQQEWKKNASQQANLIADSLKKAFDTYGMIPLSLNPEFREKNQFNGQAIRGIEEQGFSFIIGLFYPTLTQLDSAAIKKILPVFQKAYPEAYEKCLVRNDVGKTIGLQLAEYQSIGLGWLSHSAMADLIAQKLLGQNYDSSEIYFPLLYDSPGSYSDGQFFSKPFYPPQTSLMFYPRGGALFGMMAR
jgi:hypothetical protein